MIKWHKFYFDAIELAAQGKYNNAWNYLESINNYKEPKSAILSTKASFLRQQGNHKEALAFDAKALNLIPIINLENAWETTSWFDAKIGLAADFLGLNRFCWSDQILNQVKNQVNQLNRTDFWHNQRHHLRYHWVQCESYLYQGKTELAIKESLKLKKFSEQIKPESIRHYLKSELIYLACNPDKTKTADLKEELLSHNLLPLAWAACLLIDDPKQASRIKEDIQTIQGK